MKRISVSEARVLPSDTTIIWKRPSNSSIYIGVKEFDNMDTWTMYSYKKGYLEARGWYGPEIDSDDWLQPYLITCDITKERLRARLQT